MPKRPRPVDDDVTNAIKKQEIGPGNKGRPILSASSERALQLLFLGAAKQFKTKEEQSVEVNSGGTIKCVRCSKMLENEIKCSYCDQFLCLDCTECCGQCQQDFCLKCVFVVPEKDCSICYSCY